MRTVYSTDDLIGNRTSVWRSAIRDVFADLDVDGLGEHFYGYMRRVRLGALQFAPSVTDSLSVCRASTHVATDPRDAYLCVIVRGGELSVAQFGRECTVPAGHFTLLHLDAPYRLRHGGRADKLGVTIPTLLFESAAGRRRDQCAMVHGAREGVGLLAAQYMADIAADAAIARTCRDDLARVAVDLLAIALETDGETALPGDTATLFALRRRCKAYIRAHRDDPHLDAAAIADGIGISVRYLHKCFAGTGESVSDHLRRQRLAAAYCDLTNPRLHRLPVAEIAYRNGFRNASHFSECFKGEYGVSPRGLREKD